jgi:hypothetical protein
MRKKLLVLSTVLSLVFFAAAIATGEMPSDVKKKFKKLAASRNAEDRAAAIRLLTQEDKESKALKKILKFLNNEYKDVVWEAAFEVMKGFKDEKVIHSVCLIASKCKHFDRRAEYMRVLWGYDNEKAFDTVFKHIKDPAWQVRMTIAELIADTLKKKGLEKTKQVIDRLVKWLPIEPDKRTQMLVRAALYFLTGMDFSLDKNKWETWWKENREGYTGPAKDTPEIVDRDGDGKPDLITVLMPPEPKIVDDGRPKPKFFGQEIKGGRVAFVIDVSGSMSESSSGGRSKLQVVKDEMEKTISAFNKGFWFNMFFYSNGVSMWKKKLQKATKEIRDEAIKYVRSLRPLNMTNISAALKMAADDAETDSIILLSDGKPTMGITNTEALLKYVRSWNKYKKIKISTVGMVGSDANFMQKLASQNGGKYTTAR